MPKSATERSREWRKKNARKGGRQLSVWLEADTAAKLDSLISECDKVADVIAKAIDTLHSVASNDSKPQLGLSFDKNEETVSVASNVTAPKTPELHPALKPVKARLDQGEAVADLRASFSEAAKALTGEGLSQRKIAALLNEAGFPTLSGSGQWGKTTVARLLQATKNTPKPS